MGIGIQICGLNGCGKTTLGKALAKRIEFYFIDNEDLYFNKNNEDNPYINPKSHFEVEILLKEEINNHPDFVFSAVKGDYGKDIVQKFNYIILIEVPLQIRLERIRNRSFQKFGSRMLIGGDLYEQEESFFQAVELRRDDYLNEWLDNISCPIIRIDGTKSIDENIKYIINVINNNQDLIN